MKSVPPPAGRSSLDTIELARMETLLSERSPDQLRKIFTDRELNESGRGDNRTMNLAVRFTAREACLKLFPREKDLGVVTAVDFEIQFDEAGSVRLEPSAAARTVFDLHRIADVLVSITRGGTSVSATARVVAKQTEVPWFGKLIYHVLPWRRRVVLANLGRVFGDVLPESEIRRLAQSYYAHIARSFMDFVRLRLMSPERRKQWVRVENAESPVRAHEKGHGLLLLTGHMGNWEVATVVGIGQFPQYRNLFHFVRRPLKPQWLNDLITRRFQRSGFGTLAKRGSLDTILELLKSGAIVGFVFDQHAGKGDGIPVDFFGHPAGTFKSLALIALDTGAPVIPASCWREPDGSHVLRFEEPLPLIECDDAGEAIRQNTRAYNAILERMLLRHPEQWIWMHRRWKISKTPAQPAAASHVGGV